MAGRYARENASGRFRVGSDCFENIFEEFGKSLDWVSTVGRCSIVACRVALDIVTYIDMRHDR